MTRLLFLLPLVGLTLLPRLPAAPDQPSAVDDVVLFWNEQALAAICTDGTAPPIAARNFAIVHLAIHDAMARASGDAPLRPTPLPSAGATAEAAANGAAHAVLTGLYPELAPRFDAALRASAGTDTDADGRAFGRAVAADVLRWRASDMRLVPGEYTPRRTEAGWEPTPPGCRKPLLPGWASVRPFVIPSAAEFRPHGPPPITVREFADSYRRVMAIGAADSSTRTDDQTEIAIFWADGTGTVTPPGHWNRIARTVAVDRGLTPIENARLFVVLNLALADAGVVCWDGKYHFDFWRPMTAIRCPDKVAALGLPSDRDWQPRVATPPFPAYPSGHSTFSGAGAAVLAAFFGTDEVRFTSTSEGTPGVVRAYPGFAAAADEAGISRIYGGIHWDCDNVDGLACGKHVGEYVARQFLGRAEPEADGSSTPFTLRNTVPAGR